MFYLIKDTDISMLQYLFSKNAIPMCYDRIKIIDKIYNGIIYGI